MQPQEFKSDTVKIAACWPEYIEGESSPEAVLQQHESVRWAYSTDLQMLDTPSDLVVPEGFSIVSVQEEGNPLEYFDHPLKAVYVTGNTTYRYPMDHIPHDSSLISTVTVGVPSDGNHPLYGHQALAIVLNDRRQKNINSPKEMQCTYDEVENLHWWRVFTPGRLIAQMSAEQRTKGSWYLRDGYVEPEYRRMGIWGKMFIARQTFVEAQSPALCMVICNSNNYNTFTKNGFESMHTVEDYGYEEFLMVKDYT